MDFLHGSSHFDFNTTWLTSPDQWASSAKSTYSNGTPCHYIQSSEQQCNTIWHVIQTTPKWLLELYLAQPVTFWSRRNPDMVIQARTLLTYLTSSSGVQGRPVPKMLVFVTISYFPCFLFIFLSCFRFCGREDARGGLIQGGGRCQLNGNWESPPMDSGFRLIIITA